MIRRQGLPDRQMTKISAKDTDHMCIIKKNKYHFENEYNFLVHISSDNNVTYIPSLVINSIFIGKWKQKFDSLQMSIACSKHQSCHPFMAHELLLNSVKYGETKTAFMVTKPIRVDIIEEQFHDTYYTINDMTESITILNIDDASMRGQLADAVNKLQIAAAKCDLHFLDIRMEMD
nr:unnamed protein product [Callosobruchus chinensis]